MFTVSCTEEIRRPPGEVFEFAGNYANDPAWRKGVVAMVYEPSGPASVGARTRETMRSLGLTTVTVAEITEYSSSRTAFRSLSGPVPCNGTREFVASPTGTRFTYSLTLRPAGVLRVLEPLVRLVLAKQVRSDVGRLKIRLEEQS